MKALAMVVLFIASALLNGCAASSTRVYEGISEPFAISTEFWRASGNGTGNTITEAVENALHDANMRLDSLLWKELRPEEAVKFRKGAVTERMEVALMNGGRYSAQVSLRRASKITIIPSKGVFHEVK